MTDSLEKSAANVDSLQTVVATQALSFDRCRFGIAALCYADLKRKHLQEDMQHEHKATSALRAANRKAEGQLAQARQASYKLYCHSVCVGAVALPLLQMLFCAVAGPFAAS